MYHGNKAKDLKIVVDNTVFVYFLSKKKGISYKIARLFQSTYLVWEVDLNGEQLICISSLSAGCSE